MPLTVMLELPDILFQDAHHLAQQTEQRVEDVLLEWLQRGASDRPVELLSNEQLLVTADSQLPTVLQNELSELLALNREGLLESQQQSRLDELMQVYRKGLVRKAQALKEAVARGIHPPLNKGQP